MRWMASAMVRTCDSLSMTHGPAMRKRLPPPTRTGPISNSRLTKIGYRVQGADCRKERRPRSVALGLIKSQAEQQLCHGATGVLVRHCQDAGSQRRLAQIFDRLRADLALKGGVDRYQQPRGTGVDVGLLIVEVDGEELRRRQVHVDRMPADLHVAGGELAEVDAGNRPPVDFEQDAVAGQKRRQNAAFTIAGDHLVHRECHRFEPCEASNLHHDGGLRGVDAEGAGAQHAGQPIPDAAFSFVQEERKDGRAEESSEQKRGENDR